jgi:hypothetical protein
VAKVVDLAMLWMVDLVMLWMVDLAMMQMVDLAMTVAKVVDLAMALVGNRRQVPKNLKACQGMLVD